MKLWPPQCHKYIVEHCKTHPYSVGTDGSNDTGVKKMNPVSVRIFDINRSNTVTNHFFDMCLTEGEHGAKAFKIFEAIEEKFTKDSMLWSNCVSLSIDNTNTMIGRNDSVALRFLEKNPEMFILIIYSTVQRKLYIEYRACFAFERVLSVSLLESCYLSSFAKHDSSRGDAN